MRDRSTVPLCPRRVPAKNVQLNVAVLQLWTTRAARPTRVVVVVEDVLNTPPLVSKMPIPSSALMPGTNDAGNVYPRWLSASVFGDASCAKVCQATNKMFWT